MMDKPSNLYKRHRFPPEIIQYAVWLYYRFNLSFRDIEDLLATRKIIVTRESVRLWCNKFGPKFARRLRQKHRGFGDTFYIDEVFVKIEGKQQYLWRAIDQDGEVIDVFLQLRRDGASAIRYCHVNKWRSQKTKNVVVAYQQTQVACSHVSNDRSLSTR